MFSENVAISEYPKVFAQIRNGFPEYFVFWFKFQVARAPPDPNSGDFKLSPLREMLVPIYDFKINISLSVNTPLYA